MASLLACRRVDALGRPVVRACGVGAEGADISVGRRGMIFSKLYAVT